MNETLEKILKPVKKAAGQAVVKVGLPLLLTFGAYQGANAQSGRYDLPPTKAGTATFEVLSEQERDIHLDVQVNPYVAHVTEDKTYTLDVLTVKHSKSGNIFTILYPGDKTWNNGDIIRANYEVHSNRSDNTWTDWEIESKYMRIPVASASNPTNEDIYDGIITHIFSHDRNYDQD